MGNGKQPKTVTLIPSFGEKSPEVDALDDALAAYAQKMQEREATARKIFPELFSDRYAEKKAVDPICVVLLRDQIAAALAETGITDQAEFLAALDRLAKEQEEIERETYENAAFWQRLGYSDYEIKRAQAQMAGDGFFAQRAFRALLSGKTLTIFENPDDSITWALCAAYVRLEKNIFTKKGQKNYFVRALPQAELMTVFSLLANALLLKELDYPECSKQKGGRPLIETRDDVQETFTAAVKKAGGVELFKHLMVDEQIDLIRDASELYGKEKRRVSYSTGRAWNQKGKKAGWLDEV